MFSIIIPCQKFNPYLEECLKHIFAQDYFDFEIIVLPDTRSYISPLLRGRLRGGIRIIPTGPIKPGAKRNIGAQHAQGEILAFVDDDAYPASDWFKNAIKYFEDGKVVAIGGPGLTPSDDSFWQQVSGAMYLSWFAGANPNRFWPSHPNPHSSLLVTHYSQINDWPSMNFLIRKNDFLAVGGFDENFWPGEDTALCHNLVKAGKKILYCPDVLVYHHRRKNLLAHLNQAGQFGWQRGLFAKKFPANSRKIKYFLPSLFLLFALFGWLALFLPQPFNLIYFLLWLIYFVSLIISFVQIYAKIKKIKIALATLIYIPLTHLWYGWRFLQGLLKH